MVDDPEEQAPKWDDKLPPEPRDTDEIRQEMRDKFGHVLPNDYIDAVAPHVKDLRDARDGDLGISSGSDIVFDPDSGQWRDPDTGEFRSGPDE